MKTLNNKQFMSILHQCCSDGHVDDEIFNLVLSNYWPYSLTFHRDLEKNEGDE